MKHENLLGPWVRRFLLEHLVAERNLSRNTQASYRDTLMLLLPFASKQGLRRYRSHDRGRPDAGNRSARSLTIWSMTVSAAASPATKGSRPSIRWHVSLACVRPSTLAWCAEIRAVPFKKTAKTVIGYLEKAEMDALLNQPDRRTESRSTRPRPTPLPV